MNLNAIDFIENFKSSAYDNRIKYVIFHYTEEDTSKSLELLAGKEAKVSAHYLIEENGLIYRLVPEDKMAFHSGESSWKDRKNLNPSSIGIEIVNLNGNYNNFTDKQINSLIKLSLDIKRRYNLPAESFIGHSDIAPERKVDPGKLFPWKKLSKYGIGIWYEKIDEKRPEIINLTNSKSKIYQTDIDEMGKNLLTKIGYNTTHFRDAIRAFRRHFNPKGLNEDMLKIRDIAIMLEILDKTSDKK